VNFERCFFIKICHSVDYIIYEINVDNIINNFDMVLFIDSSFGGDSFAEQGGELCGVE
jgi:hypothetical protein